MGSRVFAILVWVVVLQSLRNSLLTSGLIMTISSVGAWQYLNSSVDAADVRTAAVSASQRSAKSDVLILSVTDEAFMNFFEGQSPLRQDKVVELLGAVAHSAKRAEKLVVDIDLAPHGKPAQQEVLDQFLAASPGRWVLAAADGSTEEDTERRAAWRKKLCDSGVAFASASLATHFGQVNLRQQYSESLGFIATSGKHQCVDPRADTHLVAQPVSPLTLRDGPMIPFNGNIEELKQLIESVDPAWVVIGGTWGKDDKFLTPFGDRFGVQVHAANLSGIVEKLHRANPTIVVLVSWFFVGVLETLVIGLNSFFNKKGQAPLPDMGGHFFFLNRVRPISILVVVGVALYFIQSLIGYWYGRSGLWIGSSAVVSVCLLVVMIIWNWGKSELAHYQSGSQAWKEVFWSPIKKDMDSMLHAFRALLRMRANDEWNNLSRGRLTFEFLMAASSVAAQTLLPFYGFFISRGY
jgi:hypothetical protein